MFGPLSYFLGHHWWALLALILILFWGRPLGALLRLWLKLRLFLLRLSARPGALCCPECAALLRKSDKPPRPEECPRCEGKWAVLPASWYPYEKGEGREQQRHPCPRCLKTMKTGSFIGKKFTVDHCAACGGYWFSRIDWVSFELGL